MTSTRIALTLLGVTAGVGILYLLFREGPNARAGAIEAKMEEALTGGETKGAVLLNDTEISNLHNAAIALRERVTPEVITRESHVDNVDSLTNHSNASLGGGMSNDASRLSPSGIGYARTWMDAASGGAPGL